MNNRGLFTSTLLVICLIFFLLIRLSMFLDNVEVPTKSYEDIVRLSNEYSEVKEVSLKCLEDGKITNKEHVLINEAYAQARHNAAKNNILKNMNP